MRYAIAALLLLSGCDLKFNPFGSPDATISFVTTGLSPAAVAAGSSFVATAKVQYANCGTPEIEVIYGAGPTRQSGDTFRANFTAIAGDSVVGFIGYCGFAVAGPVQVPIQVTAE